MTPLVPQIFFSMQDKISGDDTSSLISSPFTRILRLTPYFLTPGNRRHLQEEAAWQAKQEKHMKEVRDH